MTTPRSGGSGDPFEDELRGALTDEAGGPAPDALVQRVRSKRDGVAESGLGGRVVGGSMWRGRTSLGLGLAAAAVLVAAVALGGLHLRQSPPTGPGPAASSSRIAAVSTATPPPSDVTATPAATSSATRTPAATASSSVAPTPTPSPSGTPIASRVPADFQPISVTFVSASRGWVLGGTACGSGECAAIVTTADGGRTWTRTGAPQAAVVSPGAPSDSGVQTIRFADASHGWAFGPAQWTTADAFVPQFWATDDGGASWRVVSLPGQQPTQILSLEVGAGTVDLAYIDGNMTGRIATSRVGSNAWAQSPIAVGIGAGPVPAASVVLHGKAGWVVVNNRTVVSGARLSGGAWSSWTPPCSNLAGPAVLAASSEQNLFAACDVGLWATHVGIELFTSANGGASFAASPVKVPLTWLQGIGAAPSSRTVVVSGNIAANVTGLVGSFDGGAHWSVVYQAPAPATIADLGFTTSSQGVAIVSGVGTSQLVMTGDGGHSWARVLGN